VIRWFNAFEHRWSKLCAAKLQGRELSGIDQLRWTQFRGKFEEKERLGPLHGPLPKPPSGKEALPKKGDRKALRPRSTGTKATPKGVTGRAKRQGTVPAGSDEVKRAGTKVEEAGEGWMKRLEVCKEWKETMGRFPKANRKDKEEWSLYEWLRQYKSGGRRWTQARWEKLNEAFGEGWEKECFPILGGHQVGRYEAKWIARLELCKQWKQSKGQFPKRNKKDKEENSLYDWLKMCKPGGQSWTQARWEMLNEAFGEGWEKECFPYLGTTARPSDCGVRDEAQWDAILEAVKEFKRTHGRFPRYNRGDADETRLYKWLFNSMCTASNLYTEERAKKLALAFGEFWAGECFPNSIKAPSLADLTVRKTATTATPTPVKLSAKKMREFLMFNYIVYCMNKDGQCAYVSYEVVERQNFGQGISYGCRMDCLVKIPMEVSGGGPARVMEFRFDVENDEFEHEDRKPCDELTRTKFLMDRGMSVIRIASDTGKRHSPKASIINRTADNNKDIWPTDEEIKRLEKRHGSLQESLQAFFKDPKLAPEWKKAINLKRLEPLGDAYMAIITKVIQNRDDAADVRAFYVGYETSTNLPELKPILEQRVGSGVGVIVLEYAKDAFLARNNVDKFSGVPERKRKMVEAVHDARLTKRQMPFTEALAKMTLHAAKLAERVIDLTVAYCSTPRTASE
jgi:hypothetical protein